MGMRADKRQTRVDSLGTTTHKAGGAPGPRERVAPDPHAPGHPRARAGTLRQRRRRVGTGPGRERARAAPRGRERAEPGRDERGLTGARALSRADPPAAPARQAWNAALSDAEAWAVPCGSRSSPTRRSSSRTTGTPRSEERRVGKEG